MKVVNPELTTHTTVLIPRFETSSLVTFDLTNETTKETTSITVDTQDLTDGIMSITYDNTFTDKQKYEMKLYNAEGVVYRGKIIATTQETQDYKLTNGLYFYE